MTKWGTGNFAWADCSKGLSYFENCGTVSVMNFGRYSN